MKHFKLYLQEDSDPNRVEAFSAFSRMQTQIAKDIQRRRIDGNVVPLEGGYIVNAISVGLPKQYADLRIYFANKDKLSPLVKVDGPVDLAGALGTLRDKPVIILPCIENEDDLYKLNRIIYKTSFINQFIKYLESNKG